MVKITRQLFILYIKIKTKMKKKTSYEKPVGLKVLVTNDPRTL